MKVAIMQPYFLPYAGYFRLLASVEAFVFLDDVQFPRTGWVHRNKFKFLSGKIDWLTLPVVYGERSSTRILDLQFNLDQTETFKNKVKQCPSVSGQLNALVNFNINVVDNLIVQTKHVAELLGFYPSYFRSSEIDPESKLHGEARILELCRLLGASEYINLSGGRELYSAKNFESQNIKLEFFKEYSGSRDSILDRLHYSDLKFIQKEIKENLNLLD